jgi:hypothetical protein
LRGKRRVKHHFDGGKDREEFFVKKINFSIVMKALGFVFTVCDNSTGGGNGSSAIVAKWKIRGKDGTLEFKADKTIEAIRNGTLLPAFKYDYNGTILKFFVGDETLTRKAVISGTTLTLSGFPEENGLNRTYDRL